MVCSPLNALQMVEERTVAPRSTRAGHHVMISALRRKRRSSCPIGNAEARNSKARPEASTRGGAGLDKDGEKMEKRIAPTIGGFGSHGLHSGLRATGCRIGEGGNKLSRAETLFSEDVAFVRHPAIGVNTSSTGPNWEGEIN